MALHLQEISQTVAPGAHAVLLLDQAGWHVSAKLKVPDNITLVPLPPKSPELNPVENVWQFMRDNWLSSRIFRSYDDILDHCCGAWNKLIDQPWRIMSLGLPEGLQDRVRRLLSGRDSDLGRFGWCFFHVRPPHESRLAAALNRPCPSAAFNSRSRAASSGESGTEGGGGEPLFVISPISTKGSASLLLLGDLSAGTSETATDGRRAASAGPGRRSPERRPRAAAARLLAARKSGANSCPNTNSTGLRWRPSGVTR
jgi:hypothetical protein